jgi:hypothetical protein
MDQVEPLQAPGREEIENTEAALEEALQTEASDLPIPYAQSAEQ